MADKKIIYKKALPVNDIYQADRELTIVGDAIQELAECSATEVTTVAPNKNIPFSIKYADGVNWNPRGLGEGLYIYYNGWKKFNLT